MSAPAYAAPRGRRPSIEWVPIESLCVDESYQRSVDTQASQKLIAAIARDWDWDLLDVLKVSRRAGDDDLHVIDGQHRLAASALRGDIRDLPCVIKRCSGPAEEAKLFVAANRGRKPMSRLDDFRAALGAGDQEARDIERMVKTAGLSIARAMPRGSVAPPGELTSVIVLGRALRKHGEQITGQALTLIGEAFPDEALAHPTALFTAIVQLLATDGLDYDLLFQTLLSGKTADWAAWAGLKAGMGGQDRTLTMRATIRARYDAGSVALEQAA